MRPNDPLYLLLPKDTTLENWQRLTSANTLEIVTDEPVFEVFPSHKTVPQEFSVSHKINGKTVKANVEVRASMARRDARPGRNPGKDTMQGRHAAQNAGVSVVRAHREVLLEQTLAVEATDRWWGVEVSFEPVLDEVFGVTNNKQDVPYFTQALQLVQRYDNLTKDQALEEGLFDESHPLADLYPIAQRVLELARQMKATGRQNKAAANSNISQQQPGVTAGISKAKSTGALPHAPTTSDFKDKDPEEQKQEIRDQFKEHHPSFTEAEIEAVLELRDRQFIVQVLTEAQPDNDAFFWPETSGDLEILYLNVASPAYEHLLEPLRLTDERIKSLSEAQLRERLSKGADALAMLLLMWLQLEIGNQADPVALERIREVRKRWGQAIRSGLQAVMSTDDLLAASGLGDEDD